MRTLLTLLPFVALIACGEKAPSSSSSATSLPNGTASAALLSPDAAKLSAPAPDSFLVHVTTSRGNFDLKIHRAWSPNGADRLYYLFSNGYYDGVRFFRVLDGFMAQFGVNGNPAVNTAWHDRTIPDDPVVKGNHRGILSFAKTDQPNSRRTQLFINYRENAALDQMGFSGVGEVVDGMSVVDSLYHDYGEGAPDGQGPAQGRLEREGNEYLRASYALLDTIATAKVVQEWRGH